VTHRYDKRDFPVSKVRRYLEPGPIVLVSSFHEKRSNIMTLGWQTVLEFMPSLVGCLISSGNFSHGLVRRSGECVINIPTADMVDTVVGIGNSSGDSVNKFERFGLTKVPASRVKAPLIAECYASFECKLVDDSLVESRDFFIFEVLKAHIATSPDYPQTLHYTGDGVFMVSGQHIDRSEQFKARNL
jgi:flavin reductase (DIM6/NTAB) family NADH-FMN oxidoreductase RutF